MSENLVAKYTLLNWERWYSEIDHTACIMGTCRKCKLEGLAFYGFQKDGKRVAIAVCSRCGDQNEF